MRIDTPLRGVCRACERLTYRIYLAYEMFHCGACLEVTYASGPRETRDRALARKERLQNRLERTEDLARHRRPAMHHY